MNQTGDDAREVSQYAKLVGMKCARRMLLYRPWISRRKINYVLMMVAILPK